MNVRVAFASALTFIAVASGAHGEGSAQGQYEYRSSCASCHGTGGKGDGPLAKALKRSPADLTKLSEANKGVFPFAHVYNVIDGRLEVLAHGPRDMPVWGEIYQNPRMSGDPPLPPLSKDQAEAIARSRILALIEYLATLQNK